MMPFDVAIGKPILKRTHRDGVGKQKHGTQKAEMGSGETEMVGTQRWVRIPLNADAHAEMRTEMQTEMQRCHARAIADVSGICVGVWFAI